MKNEYNYLKHMSGVLMIALIASACSSKEQVTEANTSVGYSIPVDASVVRPVPLRDELEVTGSIVANQEVEIMSELTLRVKNVYVKEGSKVRQGDLLFQLDDSEFKAQLEKYKQQEILASLNESRLRDLIEKEAVTQSDYDESVTNLKVLKAQVLELEVLIGKTRITAPFDGQVGIINVHPGAIVSVNTLLTEIMDNSKVKVEFSIPEKYTDLIPVGSVHPFSTASQDIQYKTTITATAASINEDSRSLTVRGTTLNHDGKLKAGQSARIKLSLHGTQDALAVVSKSLIPTSKGYQVFVSRGGKAERIAVNIGQRTTELIEIREGLNAGDTLITSNLLRLTPGTPLQFVSVR